ncbi:MAG: hypothetical protein GWM92_01585, partial [Gemmatimonadetes bacterium]|nr:CapA family protein [Gemmatimonadota bacterium]NIR77170.1 CapA family protein [Gemmatimonadota bacterium]NIT85687.1 CapA family protein [Gemmatimonadota bacterium]NIU29516.1 CapA family protein [Gemmatimonadota bacterium]NIU34563.1 hypothetical protein [Gemmatimonadota bacterium]
TNCELVFARSGYPKPKDVAYRPPEVADEFVWQGIDMVSLANNHTMDLGPEGMRETIAALEERGIVHAGAGESLDDATRPAVVVRNGIRVGLLSFLCMSSRVAVESAAGEDEPGLASIPGHRVRVAPPGGEARRLVAPEDAALTAMEQAIRRARSLADVVLVADH